MNYTIRKYKKEDYEFIYNAKKIAYKNYVKMFKSKNNYSFQTSQS